jgi:hypothetical protein
MDQGLILGAVVGHLVMDLQDVLQVIALGRDEEDASACTFEVQGTIEVPLLVLRLLCRRRLLGLHLLGDKISEDLGLDGLP